MTAVIFGARGQDGCYLSSLLSNKDIRVIEVSRSGTAVTGDVTNFTFVKELISTYRPNYIFNFAANSSTSHQHLFENTNTICLGSLNILESVYQLSIDTKILLVGSGLQFENKGMPISERNQFSGRDPYSIARIQSVYAARYFRSKGLKVYVGYLFNHDSPLRGIRHVNQQICQAAKKASLGLLEKFELGDISVQKEFCYAADIVRGIWEFVNNDSFYEATIGSGEAYPISYWLDLCFGFYNIDWRDKVVFKEGFSSEYKILVSDPSTINSLGWSPTTTVKELSEIMLENLDENLWKP